MSPAHDLAAFDCGNEDLNDWLKRRAVASEGRSARTTVLCDGQRVAGYYCLATGAIERESLSSAKLRKNLPDPIPILVLGRLAIALEYQGRGLGKALLKDAILKTITASEIAGVRALVVHAIDDAAAQFYQRYGFVPSPLNPRALLLRIETARAALGL
ncbi:MAG: GNAT family N-acetyltransferase [Rhodospirillaceae bacterium]|nr:GNAT family N-acetyltransferase [Rhodospirillaceae bacterium]